MRRSLQARPFFDRMLRIEMSSYGSTAQNQWASVFMDSVSFLFLMLQSYMTVYIQLFLKLTKKKLLEAETPGTGTSSIFKKLMKKGRGHWFLRSPISR